MWGRRAAVVRCLSDQPTAGPVGFYFYLIKIT